MYTPRRLSTPILASVLTSLAAIFSNSIAGASGVDCTGEMVQNLPGASIAWRLRDGSIAAFGKMNIDIDGYAMAYHPKNAAAGALIHLCNAGRVYLPDGASYDGSESDATCVGRFMRDIDRIRAAGWTDSTIGVVNWYGILGRRTARIGDRTVAAVEPVMQPNGSGFYVSPTSLFDESIADDAIQSRYPNPLHVAYAAIPRALRKHGVEFGSFGVAYHTNKHIAVPFVVGDGGPAVGEGSVALARQVSGLAVTDDVTKRNRFAGQVDARDVLWVFFNAEAPPFDSKDESATTRAARSAFAAWGGEGRISQCATSRPPT